MGKNRGRQNSCLRTIFCEKLRKRNFSNFRGMVNFLIYIIAILGSVGLIQSVGDNQLFSTSLKRAVAGSSFTYGSLTTLENFTNFASFLEVAYEGGLGLSGYLFIIGIFLLITVWSSNIIKYRVAIQ